MSSAYFRVQRQYLLRNMLEIDDEHDAPLAYRGISSAVNVPSFSCPANTFACDPHVPLGNFGHNS